MKAAGWSLLILGVALVGGAAAWSFLRWRSIHAWPHADAEVISAEVVGKSPGGARLPEELYGVRAEVRFSYEGTNQQRIIEPNVFDKSYPRFARRADALRSRGTHRVYINPASHSDVVVDPEFGLELLIFPLVVACFGVAALIFAAMMLTLAYSRRNWRRAVPLYAFVWSGLLVAMAVVIAWKLISERHWPSVKARIERADVVRDEQETTDSGGHSQTVDYYALRRWVRYEVGGHTYQSVAVGSYERTAPFHQAEQESSHGGEVVLRYNPADPYDLLVKPANPFLASIPFGLGLLMGLVGWFTRGWRKDETFRGR